jgi:hypothetical protein
MAVSTFTAGHIADAFIREHDLLPTCKHDIVLHAKELSESDEANNLFLIEWLEKHDNVRKSVEQKTDEQIDLVWERKAFGPDATPQGRGAFYKKFGTEFAEQRRAAWGASPGTIKSGNEPGAENHSAEVVKKAEKIVAAEDSNSPFNPQKRFLTAETRVNEISKFIVRFGTKAAQAHAAKFQVDLAGRPLRKLA